MSSAGRQSGRTSRRNYTDLAFKLVPWPTTSLKADMNKNTLIKIARLFQKVNATVSDVASRIGDLRKKAHTVKISTDNQYFTLKDTNALTDASSPIASDIDITELHKALADTSYLSAWKACYEFVLEYQGSWEEYYEWKWSCGVSKELLEERDIAVELFENCEEDLRDPLYMDTYDGIVEKIRYLERFRDIYCATSARQFSQSFHCLTLKTKDKVVANAWPREAPRHYQDTLIGTTFVLTCLTGVFVVFAWKASSNAPGSYQDADFWFMVQSCAMCIIGTFTSLYPSFWNPTLVSSRWPHILGALGVVCTAMAIPLYKQGPKWGSLMLFIGTMIQEVMAVQLAALVGKS